MDIDVSNCETLAKVVNPYCSFSTPLDWTKRINPQIQANGGYTVEFWWKALEGTHIPVDNTDWANTPSAMRRMVLYSKVSPPRVILSIEFRSNFLDTQLLMYGTCTSGDTEGIEVPGRYKTGVWYHTAAILGAKNDQGKVGQIIMQGANYAFDFADWGWCQGADHDFIEAMQLPGGVLMSPIEVTPAPIPVKSLQRSYYAQRATYPLRRGPALTDNERATMSISYVQPGFSYPASLVAPPIILQQRRDKSTECNNRLGTDFQQDLWRETILGDTCSAPYSCAGLADAPTALMACSADLPPDSFFGQSAQKWEGGQLKFFEFLQTVTDAPVLMRGNETFETSSYLDFQTKVCDRLL